MDIRCQVQVPSVAYISITIALYIYNKQNWPGIAITNRDLFYDTTNEQTKLEARI